MFRKSSKAISLCALIALLAYLIAACYQVTGQAGPAMTGSANKEGGAGPWIELKRRNWENNGTDTQIHSDGSYTVWAVYMRTRKELRKGEIPWTKMGDLARFIEDARIFEMKGQYSAPFKSEWSWWGYVLTVRTERGVKTIRFHSEDETVPENLKRIVESIASLTK